MELTFSKNEFIDKIGPLITYIQGLPDKQYDLLITEHKKRRSIDANAYFWVLCGKLAAKTNTPKHLVYRNLIRDIGDNFQILPIRKDAVDRWIEVWQGKGLGWIAEQIGDSKLDGYVNVINYYGSSAYDREQMTRLIDSIIFECEQIGIPTISPQEAAELCGAWKHDV